MLLLVPSLVYKVSIELPSTGLYNLFAEIESGFLDLEVTLFLHVQRHGVIHQVETEELLVPLILDLDCNVCNVGRLLYLVLDQINQNLLQPDLVAESLLPQEIYLIHYFWKFTIIVSAGGALELEVGPPQI